VLEQLIQSLEPPEVRQLVHPIIRSTNDVARETAQIGQIDRADLILLGWHRPAFSKNRLGGRVGQILTQAPADVAVFVDPGGSDSPLETLRDREFENRFYEKLLVPYSANIHDDLALELAIRLLSNSENRQLTVLRVVQDDSVKSEFSYELGNMIDQLPSSLRDRINIEIVAAPDPIKVAVQASASVDLTIAGTSRAWGIERQTLGRYTDQLAVQCLSSLLITRRYSKLTSHLSSVLLNQSQEDDLAPRSETLS
jgi:hypothetical protein